MSRLRLDFTIELAEHRRRFLEEYLRSISFIPNSEELELMGNYILWGKSTNKEDDPAPSTKTKTKKRTNVASEAGIAIATRNGTWDKKEKAESLDALIEAPSFNEAQLNHIPVRYTIPKEQFSRKKAQKNAPAYILEKFVDLWKEIDQLDLVLNYYDINSGKRINPPRDELIAKFSEEEQKHLNDAALKLNQYHYLKKRHQLVELRRQQYTLKDFYSPILMTRSQVRVEEVERFSWDFDVEVFPLGVYSKKDVEEEERIAKIKESWDANCGQSSGTSVQRLIFKENPDPSTYSEEELRLISNFYWTKRLNFETVSSRKLVFDFRNLDDVYYALLQLSELENSAAVGKERHDLDNNTQEFIDTLWFYIQLAELSDLQRELLELKIQGVKNQEIAALVNEKYGKSYTTNYISTIFRQKIIREINAAAQYHFEVIGNLFFPENFRKCNFCGRTLLLTSRNFVKKKKSATGFNSKCKRCEKERRAMLKKEKERKGE